MIDPSPMKLALGKRCCRFRPIPATNAARAQPSPSPWTLCAGVLSAMGAGLRITHNNIVTNQYQMQSAIVNSVSDDPHSFLIYTLLAVVKYGQCSFHFTVYTEYCSNSVFDYLTLHLLSSTY